MLTHLHKRDRRGPEYRSAIRGIKRVLRLSRLADYAVVVALRLSAGPSVQTASGIAAATGIPEPTVAKVLKMLAAAGLAVSLRGAHGGYRIARSLELVSVADVIEAVDGPVALTACVDGATSGCEVSGRCALHGRWDVVNRAVRGALESVSIAELRAFPIQAAPSSVLPPGAPGLTAG